MSDFVVRRASPDLVHTVARGEFDASVQDKFRAALRKAEELLGEPSEAAPEAPAPTLVIDLRSVTFIDSTAVSELVLADRRSKQRGTRMAVVATSGPVTRVLEMTGLDRFLNIVPDISHITDESPG